MKMYQWLLAGLFVTGIAMPLTTHAGKADGKKAKLIATYDQDGNGVIDGEEMGEFRKAFAADEEGALKGYDKDENGELSDEEIMAIKPGRSGDAKKTTGDKKPAEKQAEEAE